MCIRDSIGAHYQLWKDHINLIAELNDGKYFSGGIYFKIHLKSISYTHLFTEALSQYNGGKDDSMLSCVRNYRFYWKDVYKRQVYPSIDGQFFAKYHAEAPIYRASIVAAVSYTHLRCCQVRNL